MSFVCQLFCAQVFMLLYPVDGILEHLFVLLCLLAALTGIFSQILQGDEQIRERAITFLSTKIRVLLVEDMLPKDAEEELVALCKKVN